MPDENTNIEGEEGQEVVEPVEQGWQLSQDEWNRFQEDQKRLTGMISSLFEPDDDYIETPTGKDGEIDLTDPRQMAELVGAVVDHRLNAITPYVKTAAKDQGQRVMKEMFTGLEGELKKEFPAGFDHALAERTAFYFFDQTGDAEKSVAAAARYAAEQRQADREAALEETRTRATRGGRGATDEPGAGASAVPARPPAKDYDEVIERYTHQTEAT